MRCRAVGCVGFGPARDGSGEEGAAVAGLRAMLSPWNRHACRRWLMELTDDDVLEILKLFEQSKFDFLQLEQGERKITVSKGGYVPTGTGAASAALSRSAPQPIPAAAQPAASL